MLDIITALIDGAMFEIARCGWTTGVNQGAMVAEAVNYAKASVPDAIKRLWPVGTVLAVAKIEGGGNLVTSKFN
ncbi:hypothetical protein [Albirhodobacter sp. R86504]|uniref:hypothetical protein n=1 Tax=Albirhodobacter sp. R86504 TaxID=3093848 RepID=UPI00366C35D4